MALLAMLAVTAIYAQDPHIIGHVIDKKTNEHLPYVTISLVGTTYVTMTDGTGHYKLTNIPAGDYQIQASFVGYITQTQNITVKDKSTVNKGLMKKTSSLDEFKKAFKN